VTAERLSSGPVDKGLDLAAPMGREKQDPTYDSIAATTDKARSIALRTNPFAEKISGLAMEGVHKIHRQTLEQLDAVVQQLATIDTPASAASAVIRPSPPSPVPLTRNADNPLSGAAAAPPAPPTVVAARENTFAQDSIRYDDAATGRSYDVPTGRTLYRHQDSGDLMVMEEARVVQRSDDDRMVNGRPVCSAHGKGRVLPECERRRANPFATAR